MTSQTGEFDWSRDLQGLVLGGTSYGSLTMQLGGGFLATKFGPKWVIFTGMTTLIVTTLLSPLAAQGSVYLLFLFQVLKGAAGVRT